VTARKQSEDVKSENDENVKNVNGSILVVCVAEIVDGSRKHK
jgi:hypothetical protein